MTRTLTEPKPAWIAAAIRAAADIRCAKSHRGVAIFRGRALVADASNGPPFPFECGGDDACRAACNRVAVHAEERAIIRARTGPRSLDGADLVHVKIDSTRVTEVVPSGGPSCWQCSRMIVEANIGRVWLFHEAGWRSYTAHEFHRLTLEACGLPASKECPR